MNEYIEKQLVEQIPYLKRIIGRRIPSYDVDDIVQDILCKAIINHHTLKNNSLLKTWLYTITTRSIMDYWRSRFKNNIETLPEELDEISNEDSPDIIACQLEEKLKIIKANDNLPKNLKEVMDLYYKEELKIREIAVRLNKPPGTIKRWMSLAKSMIKEQLR